jgi:MFS family permease
VLKASANIGNVVGQLLFGFCGDAFGRSAVYGKELIIVIVAVIMIISVPDYLGGVGVTAWMTGFRFLMGIGECSSEVRQGVGGLQAQCGSAVEARLRRGSAAFHTSMC